MSRNGNEQYFSFHFNFHFFNFVHFVQVFHLASFCDKLLKPITTNKYTVKDSFSFANKVEELDPYLATASFDLLALMSRIFIETKHVLIVYQKVLFIFY